MLKNYFPLVFFFFITISGNIYAQTTAIPDSNFEQALIDLGIDSDGTVDGQVLTSDISGITSLEVADKNISDLSGIEDFSSLKYLGCGSNQLTSLDVSQNTVLIDLYCGSNQFSSLDVSKNLDLKVLNCIFNQLTSLDLSKNTALIYLNFNENQITNIDLSKNTALRELYSHNNKLASLDVSQNTDLQHLGCSKNLLTSIDVSQNTSLIKLYCHYNQLINIDVSKNISLSTLTCYDNQLTSLDVSQNPAFTLLYCYNNPNLTCIQVANETDANNGVAPYDSWGKDATTTYSEDCQNYLGVDDIILVKDLNLYPNPVFNTLSIESKLSLEKVEIYSILGQKVKEVNSDFNSISTDILSKGIYLIRIYSEKGVTVRKLIKQ